jgi:hypothetical protein
MLFNAATLLLFGGIAVAKPTPKEENVDYSAVIKKQMEKRQDLGVIPGLPPALASFVPMIANMGILPTVVKSINCMTYLFYMLKNNSNSWNSWIRKGSRYSQRCP